MTTNTQTGPDHPDRDTDNGPSPLRAVPASDVVPGDLIKFLLGGLARVRDINDIGNGLLLVNAEIAINLHHDEIVTLYDSHTQAVTT